jgi:chromosome partitioning protein
VLSDVSSRYDLPVLEPPIAKSVRFAEAPAAGRSALCTAKNIPGVHAYREHARRLHAADGGSLEDASVDGSGDAERVIALPRDRNARETAARVAHA